MFPCKQCSTPNSLDSTFCKHCGAPLPEAEITEAKAKLDELVGEGDALFTQGRTDEAMLIAERAVAANPSSGRALSLQGMCHERLGQIAEALDCYEKVVAMSPDSALDKLKVNQLRNMLVAPPSTPTLRDRRTAILTAVAAAAFVMAIGFGLAAFKGHGADSTTVAKNSKPSDAAALPFQEQQPVQQQQQPANQPTQGGQNAAAPGAADSALGTNLSAMTSGVLPTAGTGLGPISVDPDKVIGHPPDAGAGNSTNAGNDAKLKTTDPDPTSEKPTHVGPTTPAADPDKSVIDIEVSNASHGSLHGGGSDAESANSVQNVLRVARNAYQLGQFDVAARAYSRALGDGADSGPVYQRLGQCYEKLGKNTAAVAAYSHAADSFDAAIKAGRAAPDASSALASCRLAIKLLQGN